MKLQEKRILANVHWLLVTGYCLLVSPAVAQPWTAQQCMRYAVEHNTQVRRAALTLDNYRAQHLQAVGAFLPSVSAGVGAQYNFGRAIDPETNTYTDVSTFYNGYSVQATLPVFDGFSRLNALQAARASVLMGQGALCQQQAETALATLQCFVDVLYYEGTVGMAREKQQESQLLLGQTRLLEEVGRKSAADVAQMEAQQAESDYELMRQQHLLDKALLELKQQMNYPLADTLQCAQTGDWNRSATKDSCDRSEASAFLPDWNSTSHPVLQQAYQAMRVSRYEWRQARASLFPSLSLGAGLSTTFYETLHRAGTTPFHTQFRNNMGQYVAASLSIPLFSRLQTVSNVRRAKNNYLMARDTYEQKQTELQKLSMEACADLASYRQQAVQMDAKVRADSLAYQLVRRRYEEGLATAIDLHATSATLLQSRATLLQCRLMVIVKHHLLRYYRGELLYRAGSWSESAGEEHYQMMKHRNDERPLNRIIPSFDD